MPAARAACCALLCLYCGAVHGRKQDVLAPEGLAVSKEERGKEGMTHSVVLSMGRCGTQFFIDTLSQHPNVDFVLEQELMAAQKKSTSKKLLDEFYARDHEMKDNVTVHGFKWLQHQPGINGHLAQHTGFAMDGTSKDDVASAKELMEGDFKAILLTREPSLRFLVSGAKLGKEGNFHHCRTDRGGDVQKCLAAVAKMKVSLASTETQLKHNKTLPFRLEQLQETWSNMTRFLGQNIDPSNLLVLKYEDAMARPQEVFGQAFDFLGVPPFAVDPDAAVKQNTPVPLKETLSDYDAVLSEVKGSKWEDELTAGGSARV